MKNNIDKFKSPYNWANTEQDIYQMWIDGEYFNPDKDNRAWTDKMKTFSIVLPPPNVTGTLHTGHAIMLAIEDAIVRYKRMSGYKTLWIPGTDHAAIATQSKVEKILEKEGIKKSDLSREDFFKKIQDFAMDSQATILSQCRDLGASLDWSRLAFTLDDKRSLAVRTVFKKMYDEGLIYKGHRIVNWDPKGQTVISDDEVVYKEEKTKFYYFKYGPFVIGTARPETKFGDKYIIIHPDDDRYNNYTDRQKIKVEWINGEIEATIIKDKTIDKDFGTGVMTITPWHSKVDFELAEKYNLDYEQIIDKYGKLLPIADDLSGMKIKDAREKIVEKLYNKGLLVDKNGNKIEISQIEDYTHNVATAERTGAVIEPQIMSQWFVNVNKEFSHFNKITTLKDLMIGAVQSGEVNILTEEHKKIYYNWINNLHDWCISRQIIYGHQIPIWYRGDEIYCDITPPEGDGWVQDSDTLDTWFSSGLWTFSTLGWPNNTEDMKIYHPTSLIETGYDILFPWIARMILFTKYIFNTAPFKIVYLHGLVRDSQGRKMSKSLGNVLDPRDLISKYGTDALRMSLLVANGPGNDLKLSEDKIKAYKLFVNKIWNATRLVLEKCDIENDNYYNDIDLSNIDNKNNILSTMNDTDKKHYEVWQEIRKDIMSDIENYRLHLATEKIYDYFWKTYCDIIIEEAKSRIDDKDNSSDNISSAKLLLWIILRENILIMHPFMPFVTEEIWKTIKSGNDDNLIMKNINE